MSSRKELINRYFTNLKTYTYNDKKLLQEIFIRKIKSKTESSSKFVRHVTFGKSIRIVDKSHQFYNEYISLKIGFLDWFDNLSKSFKNYLGWYLQNKEILDRKIDNSVSDIIYDNLFRKCRSEVLYNFYDEYLDDDGEVSSDVLQEFYFERKLEENYFEKLFRLYRYIVEENKVEMLNEDGSIKVDLVMDYCVLDEKIPSSLQEKIRVSVGRTKMNFDYYAKANCEKFKYFVTLTFADKEEKEKHLKLNELRDDGEYDLKFIYIEDIKSLDSCNNAFHNSFRNLKTELKKYNLDLYYLGCPEYHQNGKVHYHFLFSDIPNDLLYKVPKWLDYDVNTKSYQNGIGLINWRYGKSDVQLIKDEYKVTTYISKYIEKSLDEIDGTIYFDRLNKKRYFASNNLVKPNITYNNDLQDFEFNSVYVKEKRIDVTDNEIIDILYSI